MIFKFSFAQNFLSAIGKGEYPATMPDDMRRSFERWYREQTRQGKGSPVSSTASSPESGKENRFDASAMFGSHFSPASGYPALRGELNTTHFSRTRIRTSFDPDLEIPRLQRWFEQNQHPSRDQMIFYLNELNSLESRRGRKPLDLTNIIYWFKNARAAQRRAHRSPEPENAPDGEQDDSMEERLSPEPAVKTEAPRPTTPNGSASENVPLLPNRNAVYVVNEPLHLYKKEDCEGDSNVLHIEPEEPADQKSPQASTPTDMDHPKNSPRESNNSNDSGNGSDADQSAPVVIQPQSPGSMPQNLTVGVKRSSESLESDISDGEFDEDNDREPTYNGQYNGGDRYKHHIKVGVNSGGSISDRGSPSPSSSSGNRMSPLQHAPGIMPTHPLLTPPGVSPRQQPPPAHQQALGLPHPHLPHPLNMHLFPHPLYSPIDASSLMVGGPRPFKDSPSPTSLSEDHRKKRSRVFIDPLTEIPKLEKWFLEDTHPSSYMIEKYTEDLNRAEYRQRFPKLEPKNVQLWFKNHRAKVKRQRFEHSAELMNTSNGQSPELHNSAQ